MEKQDLRRCVDFLSIALECIETNSVNVAIEFIEDVIDELEDDDQTAALETACDLLSDGSIDDGYAQTSQINAELTQDADFHG